MTWLNNDLYYSINYYHVAHIFNRVTSDWTNVKNRPIRIVYDHSEICDSIFSICPAQNFTRNPQIEAHLRQKNDRLRF